MYLGPELSAQPPAVIVHLVVAVGALIVGPVAFWLRKGSRWHRAVGYGWITLMAAAALSSVFIRDFKLPNVLGYTAIHLLSVATILGISLGIWHISRHNVARHRRVMQFTYGAALVAGIFALQPDRYLGGLLLHQAIGLTAVSVASAGGLSAAAPPELALDCRTEVSRTAGTSDIIEQHEC